MKVIHSLRRLEGISAAGIFHKRCSWLFEKRTTWSAGNIRVVNEAGRKIRLTHEPTTPGVRLCKRV